jgi:hypothetical protein
MSNIVRRLRQWFALPIGAPEERTQLADIIRSLEAALVPTWHPLGFIHVKLADGAADDTYRLHLWSPKHRDQDEQRDKVHDHLFTVTSKVIAGVD